MIYTITFANALLLSIASAAAAGSLPVMSDVTQDNIQQTICVHGYTRIIRPPASYTNSIKRQFLLREGLPLEAAHDTKLDHRIPLALGGSPTDPTNMMLQPNDESKDKDRVEVCLARLVCAGRITLMQSQHAIWDNWKTAGRLCSGYKLID